MVDLARKILLHDKVRFLITVSGVAFAVTLVFVQVGLFEGLLSNASVTIERVDADLWVSARNTPNVDFSNTFPETFVQRVRSVPGVARADNLIVWFGRVALPSGGHRERRDLRAGGLRPLEPPVADQRGGRPGPPPRQVRDPGRLRDQAVRRIRGGRLSRVQRPAAEDHRPGPARRDPSPRTRSHSSITASPSRWTARACTTGRPTSW